MLCRVVLWFSLLAPCGGAMADNDLAVEWPAMTTDDLDDQRGGFTTDGGVSISFGIEQAVLIDGVLQVTRSFNVPEVGAVAAGITGNQIRVVQSGVGNSINLSELPLGVATFVQNSLNQTKIQNVTVINATVSNLDFVRMSQIGAALNQQLVRALR